jgi:hypothetical protein
VTSLSCLRHTPRGKQQHRLGQPRASQDHVISTWGACPFLNLLSKWELQHPASESGSMSRCPEFSHEGSLPGRYKERTSGKHLRRQAGASARLEGVMIGNHKVRPLSVLGGTWDPKLRYHWLESRLYPFPALPWSPAIGRKTLVRLPAVTICGNLPVLAQSWENYQSPFNREGSLRGSFD